MSVGSALATGKASGVHPTPPALPPACQVQPVRNPFFPLAFELMGPGEEAVVTLQQAFPELSQELHAIEPHGVYDFTEEITLAQKHAWSWAHPKALEAFKIAIQAWKLSGEAAREEANRALAVCEICPEAHNVLGARASASFIEALQHFRKAEELGPKVLNEGPRLINEATWSRVGVFHVLPMRSLFRAVMGVAVTLKRLGRHLESLEKFRYLLSLDSQALWPSTSSYIEYRAHIPEIYLRMNRPSDAIRFIREGGFLLTECAYLNPALGLSYKMSLALAYFMLWTDKGDKDCGAGFPSKASRTATDLTEKEKMLAVLLNSSGALAHEAAVEFAYCAEWLVGLKGDRPTIKAPAVIGDMFSHSHALAYCHSAGDLWYSVPGAVAFLRKLFNTAWIMQHFKEVPVAGEGLPDFRDPELFRRRVTDPEGFFYHEPVNPAGQTLLQAISMNSKTRVTAEALKLVLDHAPGIDLDKVDKQDLRPLNVFCYYDEPPEVLRVILDAGAQIQLEPWQNSPLAMAANQGNYRALLTLLEARPDLATPQLLCYCADAIFDSSCYSCVRGRGKCQRCVNEDRPHSPHMSFERCIDVLVSKGLTNLHLIRCPRECDAQLYNNFVHRIRMANAAGTQRCLACWKVSSTPLKSCSRCRRAGYCSPECQRSNWAAHKYMCFPQPTLHDKPIARPAPSKASTMPITSSKSSSNSKKGRRGAAAASSKRLNSKLAPPPCGDPACCGRHGTFALQLQPKALSDRHATSEDNYIARVLGRAGLSRPGDRKSPGNAVNNSTPKAPIAEVLARERPLEEIEKAFRGVAIEEEEKKKGAATGRDSSSSSQAQKQQVVAASTTEEGEDEWLAGANPALTRSSKGGGGGGGKRGGKKKGLNKQKKNKGGGREGKSPKGAAGDAGRASSPAAALEESNEQAEGDNSSGEEEEAPPLEEVYENNTDYAVESPHLLV